MLAKQVTCKQAIPFIRHLLFVLLLASTTAAAISQTPDANPFFARKNTFSVFVAYSNDSSHILLGDAENRKLLTIGAAYGRRLFVNRIVNWQYNGEILPVALESDPNGITVTNQTQPTATTFSYVSESPVLCSPTVVPFDITDSQTGQTYVGTWTTTCKGRHWTIGEAISPVGFQWNFMPQRKLQPFFIGHGGYMYSTQSIPIVGAGSFNFTFDIGAGFEFFQSRGRSIRAEYRLHHISNHGTAQENPGIDNGVFQVTYSFGR